MIAQTALTASALLQTTTSTIGGIEITRNLLILAALVAVVIVAAAWMLTRPKG